MLYICTVSTGLASILIGIPSLNYRISGRNLRLIQTLILQIRKPSSEQVTKLDATTVQCENWDKTCTPRPGSFLIHKLQQGPLSFEPINTTASMQEELCRPSVMLGENI